MKNRLAYLRSRRGNGIVPPALCSRFPFASFFGEMKDADPDIPILKQAKAEYAKLQ